MDKLFTVISKVDKICVAVSGGIDSMVLCHLLLRDGYSFSIAHCNFSLRGQASDLDEIFVRDFARQHHLPFYTEKYDTERLASEHSTSIEEEARNLRYDFFQRLYDQYHFKWMLTAHHAGDQVETVLMRLITGTGIQGLQGIRRFRDPNYYRPLLLQGQEAISEYAKTHKILYRNDDSNSDIKYLRNKIRHLVVPILREINPRIEDSIAKIVLTSEQMTNLMVDLFTPLKKEFKATNQVNLRPYFNKKYLPALVQFIFSEHGPNSSQIATITNCISNLTLAECYCGTILIELRQGYISIARSKLDDSVSYHNIDELLMSNEFRAEMTSDRSFRKGQIDFQINKLKFPLILRGYEEGDHIRSVEMHGQSKKVSKYLTEMKLSASTRNQKYIIEDSEQDIIAILGCTSSIKTKVDDSTKAWIRIN